MAETMRDRIRAAAKDLTQAEGKFDKKMLGDKLGIQDYAALERLQKNQICDLVRRREFEPLGSGWYRYHERTRSPEKRKTMWAVLRARRTVHVEDLMEMADSTREAALDFLRPLVKQETVQKVAKDVYRLVLDPGPAVPRDSAKCDRLRGWRERQKAVLNKADQIFNDVAELRLMVSQMGEEG